MSKFNELYERIVRQSPSLDMNRKLDKKPLSMIEDKDGMVKVFGMVGGEFKELLSMKNDSSGQVIARNFIYKNSPMNYYMHGNKRVNLPYYDER